MLKKIVLALLIVGSFSGCLKGSNEVTCSYDACAVKAPATEIQAVQSYLTANGITAVQHCSGLFYVIDNPGTGATPTACSYVAAHYKGTLTNGSTFEESDIQIGLNQVIRGWTNGIPLIKVGGKIRLFIPPSLGYGNQAAGPIPANSILIFEITLNGVQ